MRRDKVFRFIIIAFVIGAFVGLVSGLAFGGAGEAATPRAGAGGSGDPPDDHTDPADGTAASSEPMTAERAEAIGANELGQVPVVMYHLFDVEEGEWTRTPENFRNDLAMLKAEGFYPVNVRDLASGNIDIPAGKSPVVITFDDSSAGQYRILDNGSLDPDSAVGILQTAVEAGGWASRATFFCLIDVDSKDREIFGQEDAKQEKLKNLIDWGYEVGSHTVTHLNLSEAGVQEATKQLAQSQSILEEMIGGGYAVTSLSVPFGEYPDSESMLKSGKYQEISYAYTAAVSINGKPCPSPFSSGFDPLHIHRIRGSENYLTGAIDSLKNRPELRYISDGDPTTVSAPRELADELGTIRDDLGRPVIRY